ncbi:MAG: hypothetical protein LBR10_00680 [Prevotellaceae bacterium]|nr:hypothetical protein [Prevotellaceae bacterium]
MRQFILCQVRSSEYLSIMGGRKQKIREPESGVYIIGEGITEQYYFSHIKRILGFHCIIKPRFFGNTCIAEIRKKIEELLRGDIFVICVGERVWSRIFLYRYARYGLSLSQTRIIKYRPVRDLGA